MSIQSPAQSKILSRVRALVERGERVPEADVAALFTVTDTAALARIARIPRERRFGRTAFYTDVATVGYSGQDAEAVAARIGASSASIALTPLGPRIHPERLPQAARELARRFDVVVVMDAGRIAHVAATIDIAHEDVLRQVETGAPVVVGPAGAAIFDESLRASVDPHAPGAETWLGVHRAAHGIGARTIASMTYLTHEQPAAYAAHLEALRSLQDETGGFAGFVAIPVHDRSIATSYLAVPSAHQSLRALAIARIALDNVEHIAAAPALITPEVAYVAMSYGADTVDTTIAAPGAGLELPVLGEESAAPMLDRELVESRLVEARFVPVPLDAAYQPRVPATVSER
jgi:aminodeoxyfutalosine synthase